MRHYSIAPAAFTLLELILVLAIIGLTTIATIWQVQSILDRVAARTAITEAALVVARARDEAVAQHTLVTLLIDPTIGTLTLRAHGERLAFHALGHAYGVTLTTTRDSIAFDARGLGHGAANLTMIVQRGAATNSLVVSRLGRIRY